MSGFSVTAKIPTKSFFFILIHTFYKIFMQYQRVWLHLQFSCCTNSGSEGESVECEGESVECEGETVKCVEYKH